MSEIDSRNDWTLRGIPDAAPANTTVQPAAAQQEVSSTRDRRRKKRIPLLLCITDHDTGRFTLEGPMIEIEASAWIKEIIAARRADRDINCRIFSCGADPAAMAWGAADGKTHWPSGSIINLDRFSR